MIQEIPAEVTTTSAHVQTGTFLDKLVWREGSKGKWYLNKRDCDQIEQPQESSPDILNLDMGGYDAETVEDNKIHADDMVIAELGKLKVTKIEETNAFLQLEAEEIPVPLENCKKFIHLNFYVIGKTKTFQIEGVEININKSVEHIKTILSEYLSVPKDIMSLTFKNDQLNDNDVIIHTLDIKDKDNLFLTFKESKELLFKRSTSRDYTWTDAKNYIPFVVDKNIQVTALGFFRHYDSVAAVYDFFLYEIVNGQKQLVSSLTNVKVQNSEVDSTMYLKKVNVQPFILKADVTYHSYFYFKLPEMRTYYSYSGSDDQTVDGVRFRILSLSEPGHRTNTSSGHLAHIYFKLHNPYDE
jgi:hypothetical protein